VHWFTAFCVGYVTLVWSLSFSYLHFGPLESVARWMGVLLAGILFAYSYTRRQMRSKSAPLWIFVAAVGLSLPLSVTVSKSIVEYVRVLSFFLLFLSVSSMNALGKFAVIRAVMLVCVAITLISAVLGAAHVPFAFIGGDDLGAIDHPRLIGLTPHPAIIGLAATISIAFAAWLPMLRRGRASTYVASAVIIAAALFCLVKADSRTGIIAAVLTLGCGVSMPWLEKLAAIRNLRAIVIFFAAVFAAAMFLAPVYIAVSGQLQFGDTARVDTAGAATRTASLDERVELWKSMPDVLADHPFTGTGFASGALRVPRYNPILKRMELEQLPYYHSFFVNCLGTTGYIGFLAGFWIIISGAMSAAARLSEQTQLLARNDNLSVVNTRAAVLMLMATYPFGAIEGALQGMYGSYIIWFVALATLFPAFAIGKMRPRPQARVRQVRTETTLGAA
jgi:O-antigen ligase